MIYPTMSELVADKMIMDEGRPGKSASGLRWANQHMERPISMSPPSRSPSTDLGSRWPD